MPVARYYYSDTISDFLKREPEFIVGAMVKESNGIDNETELSWEEQIEVLQDALQGYAGRGSVFFEYNIPRLGRRVDAIAVIDGVVLVIEFKTRDQRNASIRPGLLQVWDYAIDLKNFQEGSLERTILPILVSNAVKNNKCCYDLVPFEDDVFSPVITNSKHLKECLQTVLPQILPECHTFSKDEDKRWANSGYSPTPTIIEAATELYNHHTVEEITKHGGDIDSTSKRLAEIIDYCRDNRRKAICFITGVPGAGKTLIGLQTAINEFNRGQKAVYLSGNFPLVEVLQEALARDYVRRSQIDHIKVTKKEARSKVKAFIQMVHHYRDTYLEGTQVVGDTIQQIPGYFTSHKDKAYVPVENVAIFDEAQRAWTKDELKRFMNDKKHIKNFPYSEPEYLISTMDRHEDWGVVVCLIGGGQEINKGEAGLQEWIAALNRQFKHWDVYISDQLAEKEYAGGKSLELIDAKERVHKEPSLHLSVSMRSFKAEKVSLFVHHLLELNRDAAAEVFGELEKYPIVLTRDLETAKQWLRSHARGNERFGILASAKAERLKAVSVNVRYQPDFVHWFLEDETDIRSSNCLEDVLTEFKVQGLEIDWSCVMWDADMRLFPDDGKWHHYSLRGGATWNNINKPINQEYQLNAYRVLLTRARQGMVIVVPEGNDEDETRKKVFYDSTYNYLKSIGIPEL